MSTLRVDNLNARTGTTIAVPTGTKLYSPGHVIQVQSTTKTDTFTTNASDFTDITGLSVTITPLTTTSKIVIFGSVCCGAAGGSEGDRLRIMRDSTVLAVGDASGSRKRVHSMGAARDGNVLETVPLLYYDSPGSTSTITYKIQSCAYDPSYPSYINITESNLDSAAAGNRGVSSILVMEIAQ